MGQTAKKKNTKNIFSHFRFYLTKENCKYVKRGFQAVKDAHKMSLAFKKMHLMGSQTRTGYSSIQTLGFVVLFASSYMA